MQTWNGKTLLEFHLSSSALHLLSFKMKSNEDIISLTPNTSYQDVSDARKSEKFETDTPEIENGELSLSERPLEEALGAEPPPPAGPDPNAYPDGGFEAWFCIAGGFGAVFSSFGWVNCMYDDYVPT